MTASVTNVCPGHANAKMPAMIAITPKIACNHFHPETTNAVVSSPMPTRKKRMPA
jgi:hypothetical protein